MTSPDDDQPIRPDEVAPAADPTGDLGGLLGGGLDFGALLEQASDMQARMVEAQEQLTETEVQGVAGGGAIRITVTGAFEFRSVEIDPGAVDADDVELLEDLVLAALNDATARVAELQENLGGGDGLDLGDLDLGGLGDLFGS